MSDPESTVDKQANGAADPGVNEVAEGSSPESKPRPAWMMASESKRPQPVELLLGNRIPRAEDEEVAVGSTSDGAEVEAADDESVADEPTDEANAPEPDAVRVDDRGADEREPDGGSPAEDEAETAAVAEDSTEDSAVDKRISAYSAAAGRAAAGNSVPTPEAAAVKVPPAPLPVDLAVDLAGDEPTEFAPEAPAPELVEESELEAALESLLLIIDSPGSDESLAGAVDQPVQRVATALRRMSARYTELGSGIDLRHVADGWRFYTRDRFAPYVERFLLDGQRAKLTRAALETLAVIAYRQPVTRARVAAVRGVNVDGVIRTLLARGLIEETGADPDTNGLLYRTTELFLERLGLSSLEDLPPLAPLLPEVDTIDDV